MNIKLNQITIDNFLSFDHAELVFDNYSGFTMIKGINENPLDNASSNGSGKSAIFDAVVWVLTGDTIRGSKDIVNLFGSDGAYVELSFSVDSNEFCIKRYKNHSKYKNNLYFYVNNEDKSGKGIKDTTKIIEQYLPDLTSELIGSVIILGQGLPQRFTNNTPSGRKEILEKLSKSDYMIEDLKSRVLNRKQFIDSEFNSINEEIIMLDTKISLLRQSVEEYNKKLNNLGTVDDIVIKKNLIESQITDNTIKLQTMKQESQSLIDINYELNSKEANIKKKLYEQLNEVEVQKNSEMQPISNELNEILISYNIIDKEIQQALSIRDICPTCGQKLPGVFKPDISYKKKQISELSQKISELKNNIKLITEKYETSKISINESSNLDIVKIVNQQKENNLQISRFNNHIEIYQKELTKLNDDLILLNSQILSFENVKNELQEKISQNSQEINEIDNKLLYKNNEYQNLKQHRDILYKINNLVNKDFRGYLLHNIIEYLNLKSKYYCKQIFNSELIDFRLDGNNILISYDGKQYENLSGGERQKIDIIIQFSIRDMLCKFLNFSCNCIVLDELFDNLDSFGCQKVLDTISTSLRDVSNVFIISHHSDLGIPYDHEITVIKDKNKVSRIS